MKYRTHKTCTFIQWNTTQPRKRRKILPFATAQMDLEIIMLGQRSQSERTNIIGSHLHVESNEQNKLTNKREAEA